MEIYAGISTYGDEGKLRQTVDKLVDFVGSTMNPLISRIRKSFTALMGAQAKDYLIEGDAGERKKIHLDRRLVIDEFRSELGKPKLRLVGYPAGRSRRC